MYSSGTKVSRAGIGLLIALVLVVAAPGLTAQSTDGSNSSTQVTMRPGNIDVALSGGLGAFIYPYLEPQIDIGLIPLGPVTLSAGAVADIGYCLLCNLLQCSTPTGG